MVSSCKGLVSDEWTCNSVRDRQLIVQEEAQRSLAAEQQRAAQLEQRLADAATVNGSHGLEKVSCRMSASAAAQTAHMLARVPV